MDEIPEMSMHDILPNIFKCLKEQQYIRHVVHQHHGYRPYVLRRGHFMSTKTTQENHLMRTKRLLNKLKHPEEQESLWLSPTKTLPPGCKSQSKNDRWLLRVDPTEVPTVMCTKFSPTVMVFGVVVVVVVIIVREGHIMTPPLFHRSLESMQM
ncbi:hypothetical protein ACTXT7_007057 [Hymenolepis weldensis]